MSFYRPTYDRLMSLPEAATYLRGLTGKKPHISTIWRWCLKGCKGVRLESICVGGRRMVSAAAIDRFIDDCTRRQTAPEAQPVVPRPQLAAHVMRLNERRRAEIEAALRGQRPRASRPMGRIVRSFLRANRPLGPGESRAKKA